MFRTLSPALLLSLLVLPAAAQQQSQSYKFLEAIRKADGSAVESILGTPGQRIINTRDVTSGEGAIHIVTKRGDATYLRYLLVKGADPNLKDARGNTAMMLATEAGSPAMIDLLKAGRANANVANNSGETPLIRAVQRRDLPVVRALLAAGANPDQTDNIAGMSARDYAKTDARSPAILKEIEASPARTTKAVAGPKL